MTNFNNKAKKIVNGVTVLVKGERKWLISEIETALAEVERESALAYIQGQIEGTKREEQKWVERGRLDERERCAQVVENFPYPETIPRVLIAQAIRNAQKEDE